MSNSDIPLSRTDFTSDVDNKAEAHMKQPSPSSTVLLAQRNGDVRSTKSSFWRECLLGAGLIVSMALFYLIGNHNVEYPIGNLAQLNPLLAWPFLLVFVVLCWFRLNYALAFLPLALPYYLQQKDLAGNARFSPVEIALWICMCVALVQFFFTRRKWRYYLRVRELRDRLGPFVVPIAVFVAAALLSIVVANAHSTAFRAFRLEVFDPLLYVGLIFCCLRTPRDLVRLIVSLFATGLIIAFIAIVDYKLYGLTDAVYGSPNSVGLLFDYTLPIGLALIFSRLQWKMRLLFLILCIPFCYALLHNDSRGSAMAAFPVVLIFIIVLAIRNRKVLLIGSALAIVLVAGGYGVLHTKVNNVVMTEIIDGHADVHGVTTLQRRIYLWESALAMIHDNPWTGYGMDNWLCHYANPHLHYFDSLNHPVQLTGWAQECKPVSHYYMVTEVNGKLTHMTDEPNLSHPHNIFLQVWVSMGIFGLLALVTLLILFYRLFACLLMYLARNTVEHSELLRWLTVGVGASMLAALIQGLMDSAFLEQDLSFCFWTLVATLLVLRSQIGMPWKAMLFPLRRR